MNMNTAARITYFLLRVVAGLMLCQSGGMKLFGWFGGPPPEGGPLTLQIRIGAVLEVVGGTAIMLGLFVRPVAFILSGMMAVAYFQFHQPSGTWPVQNHGMSAVLLCFIFLYMAAQGAGSWSIDAKLRRKRDRAV